MGTTCVAAVVQGETLSVAHAGDSRAYLLRDGALERLTDDHSYVAEQVRAGAISEESAQRSRFRNVITRAVGIEPTITPDVSQRPVLPGDTLLLCTDGLTNMVPEDQIARTLQQAPSPQAAAERLIQLANRNGGKDNITAVVARLEVSNRTQRMRAEEVARLDALHPDAADACRRPGCLPRPPRDGSASPARARPRRRPGRPPARRAGSGRFCPPSSSWPCSASSGTWSMSCAGAATSSGAAPSRPARHRAARRARPGARPLRAAVPVFRPARAGRPARPQRRRRLAHRRHPGRPGRPPRPRRLRPVQSPCRSRRRRPRCPPSPPTATSTSRRTRRATSMSPTPPRASSTGTPPPAGRSASSPAAGYSTRPPSPSPPTARFTSLTPSA